MRKTLPAACVTSAALVMISVGCDRGPTYQGKPASAWVGLSRDRDPKTRAEAVRALDAIGTPDVLPALRERMNDDDYLIRTAAVAAILRHDPGSVPSVVTQVTGWLTHPDHRIRWSAADVLAVMGKDAKPALPALKNALAAPDVSDPVRTKVTAAIQRIEGAK